MRNCMGAHNIIFYGVIDINPKIEKIYKGKQMSLICMCSRKFENKRYI